MKERFSAVLGLLLAAAFLSAATPALDQPHIQAARSDLLGAKSELQKAEHNKGGHRAKAVEYVNFPN